MLKLCGINVVWSSQRHFICKISSYVHQLWQFKILYEEVFHGKTIEVNETFSYIFQQAMLDYQRVTHGFPSHRNGRRFHWIPSMDVLLISQSSS
jgi:hypothetical protein